MSEFSLQCLLKCCLCALQVWLISVAPAVTFFVLSVFIVEEVLHLHQKCRTKDVCLLQQLQKFYVELKKSVGSLENFILGPRSSAWSLKLRNGSWKIT